MREIVTLTQNGLKEKNLHDKAPLSLFPSPPARETLSFSVKNEKVVLILMKLNVIPVMPIYT